MRKSESSEKSAVVPADAVLLSPSSDKKAAKALENIKAKYAHVDTQMIWRARDGKHLIVVIRCTVPGCAEERCCFTSDAFQTRTCVAHKGWDKSAAPKAEKAVGKRSRSKDAPKGTRKSRTARKGTPRARKAKTNATVATGKGE